MESTGNYPETLAVDRIMGMMDSRYTRTDSERARSRLTAYTEFKRENQEI